MWSQNTSDPAAKHATTSEATGAVASDSLAAESTNAGGAFSENNSAPLNVSGSKSTLANTDISGATTLAPAPDAAEREAKAAWQENADETKGPGGAKYSEAAGGQGNFPGSHNADGYSGGSSAAKKELENESGSATYDTKTSNAGDGSSASALEGDSRGETGVSGLGASTGSSSEGNSESASAPGYVGSVVSEATRSGKPKGKNITEGGFDSDDKNNASFTSDIGDENDPGRLSENKFQRSNAESGPDAGSGPRQKGLTGDGQYDALETEQSL